MAADHIKALEAEMHRGAFFADIPVMPDCQEVVSGLSERYEVFVATAVMDHPRSCNAKFNWLQQHFPAICKDCYVFCGEKTIIQGLSHRQ